MFSSLRCMLKATASFARYAKVKGISETNIRHLTTSQPGLKENSPPNLEIVEVNMDKMMYEDSNNEKSLAPRDTINATDLSGVQIAPIDVNPWSTEEELAGTVLDYSEKAIEEIHYPEPPENRSGYYEFEGIKIWLPQKMLSPGTYRYRLDEDEVDTLPDDIRICKFENFKPSDK